jgi:hypothetical protein
MVNKMTEAKRGKTPEPLSGGIGKKTPLYDLGVDRGHVIALSVGGPDVSAQGGMDVI